MKTLYESLLGDLEDNLAKGDNVGYLLNVPTIKDFVRANGYQILIWYCPDIIQRYIHNYPAISKYSNDKRPCTGFKFTVEKIHSKKQYDIDIHLTYADKYDKYGYNRGTHTGLNARGITDVNMSQCKKSVIKVIEKMVNDEKIMDSVFKQIETFLSSNDTDFKGRKNIFELADIKI